MLNLRKINDEEKNKYKDILDMAEITYGFELNDGYIVDRDSKEEILFVCGPVFMLFSRDNNGKIVFSSFIVNENYEVISITKGDKQINVGDNYVYTISEDYKHEALVLYKNDRLPDFEIDSNGIVEYMQYDKKNDVRVLVRYNHNIYGNSMQIYPYHLDMPYYLSMESKVSKRDRGLKFLGWKDSFYRFDFNVYENRWQYDIAVLKDCGIGALWSDNNSSLLREFSKYYRVLFQVGDYVTITSFPLGRQYDREHINKMIMELGFNVEIPNYLLGLYNGKKDLLAEKQQVADLYKSSIYAKDNEHLLTFK